MMPPANIRQVAENLHHNSQASIATLCLPILSRDDFNNPNIVKVVRDRRNFALYFSRAPIPARRGDVAGSNSTMLPNCYRHIGLYAYRMGYLKAFAKTQPCQLETLERLEQLRALWYGHPIHVADALQAPGPGVDTAEDLAVAERLLSR